MGFLIISADVFVQRLNGEIIFVQLDTMELFRLLVSQIDRYLDYNNTKRQGTTEPSRTPLNLRRKVSDVI